jgi:hypothetical protein
LEQSTNQHEETRRQLERARRDLERARRDADEAKRAVGSQPSVDEEAPVEVDPIVVKPLVAEVEPEVEVEPVEAMSDEPATHEPAPPTPRIQGTFRSRSHASRASAPSVDAIIAAASVAKTKPEVEETPAPAVTTFRTVDSGVKRKRAGGPEVEREAALVRHVAPADPEPSAVDVPDDDVLDDDVLDDDAAAEPAPIPAWRRTAMAELTALAADSDDLTPRRRR